MTRIMKYFILLIVLFPLNEVHARGVTDVLNGKPKPVFNHAVYFWLNDNVTADEKRYFMDLLKSLKRIKTVKRLYVGTAAGTPRKVVDNSYDVALIVQFTDKAGHDAYQADPIHKEVVGTFEKWIRDVKIYDTVSEE